MRERNYCNLASYGFRSARWLPIQTDRKLRPVSDIASRLYALIDYVGINRRSFTHRYD